MPDQPSARVTPLRPSEPAPAAPKKMSVRTRLVNFVATTCHLVQADGKPYAVPGRAGGPLEVSLLGGRATVAQPLDTRFRYRLLALARLLPEGGTIGKADADTALEHLRGMAFDGPAVDLSLRFADKSPQGRIVIDLAQPGRADDHALVITGAGWDVTTPPGGVNRRDDVVSASARGMAAELPGVLFRRSHATKPLPEPQRGGRLDELAGLLALDPAGETFAGLVGWLIGLPFASSVRPGLLLVGPPGTGKSTRMRLLTSVLEPSGVEALGSAFGQNFGDDQVRALHRAVPMWDNLTAVSGTMSDALCCLVTGTARETRVLFSDNDLNVVPIARPVGLSAVGVPAGLRPDALDRLVVLDMPAIDRRLDDARLQARFDEAHPRLLGAVADAVSAVLRWRPQVEPPAGFRMAAYAHVLAAVDKATRNGQLPGCPTGLLDAYAAAHRRIKERTAAEDVFGGALLALLETRGGQWRGKASELITAAAMHSTSWNDRAGPGWPASPRRVPEVLAHLRDGLAALGVRWQTTTVRGSTTYQFWLLPEEAS